MAHGVKINGTNYGISGGKVMVGGTAYSVSGGKTKVNGTNYTVSFGPPLITFYADANGASGTYQAEEGMTWGAFVNSSYNTGKIFTIGDFGGFVMYNDLMLMSPTQVSTDVIQAGKTYK